MGDLRPIGLRCCALVGLALAATGCVRVPPAPLLRTAALARPGPWRFGGAIGSGAGMSPNSPDYTVGWGGLALSIAARKRLGPTTDAGIEVYTAGIRADLGVRLDSSGHAGALFDPSLGVSLVPGGISYDVLPSYGMFGSTPELVATLPLVLDGPIGSSRLAFAFGIMGTWSPTITVPAPGALLVQPAGFALDPMGSFILDSPLAGDGHLVVELDGSYFPQIGAGFVALTVGVVHR